MSTPVNTTLQKDTTVPYDQYKLKMRQLPKPEYRLMKALVQKYHLEDESELFAVALHLWTEVERYKDGQGERWIIQTIDHYRSTPAAQREG